VSHDYDPRCCPVLRFAAEAERAIVIGMLRQKHGCPGPHIGGYRSCPYENYTASAPHTDSTVPRVGKTRDDGRKTPGEFL